MMQQARVDTTFDAYYHRPACLPEWSPDSNPIDFERLLADPDCLACSSEWTTSSVPDAAMVSTSNSQETPLAGYVHTCNRHVLKEGLKTLCGLQMPLSSFSPQANWFAKARCGTCFPSADPWEKPPEFQDFGTMGVELAEMKQVALQTAREADELASVGRFLLVSDCSFPDKARYSNDLDPFAGTLQTPSAFGPDATQVIANAFRDLFSADIQPENNSVGIQAGDNARPNIDRDGETPPSTPSAPTAKAAARPPKVHSEYCHVCRVRRIRPEFHALLCSKTNCCRVLCSRCVSEFRNKKIETIERDNVCAHCIGACSAVTWRSAVCEMKRRGKGKVLGKRVAVDGVDRTEAGIKLRVVKREKKALSEEEGRGRSGEVKK